MQSPQIVFVSHTGAISGAERVLIDVAQGFPDAQAFVFEDGRLAKALKLAGADVKVAAHGGNLAKVRRSNSLFLALPMLGSLMGLVREIISVTRRCDIVYANSQKAFTLCALASVFSKKPLVWHLHDILSSAHFGAKQRKMQVFLANRYAVLVIVPSQAARDALVEAGGKASISVVVPNGVRSASGDETKTQLRERLSLPQGPLVGVFSRLAPWKGQDVVIRALAGCSGVSAIIAGEPLFGEQIYADQLKQLVTELQVQDRVRFLGHRDDVSHLMQAVDVVIHPSVDAEPFGLTLVEAMLARVPIIASSAGASSEILENGKAGALVPPGDVKALESAILVALNRHGLPDAQLEYARLRAETVYSVALMQQSIRLLLQQLDSAVVP